MTATITGRPSSACAQRSEPGVPPVPSQIGRRVWKGAERHPGPVSGRTVLLRPVDFRVLTDREEELELLLEQRVVVAHVEPEAEETPQ